MTLSKLYVYFRPLCLRVFILPLISILKASDVKNVSEVAPIYPYYDDLKDKFKEIEIDNI